MYGVILHFILKSKTIKIQLPNISYLKALDMILKIIVTKLHLLMHVNSKPRNLFNQFFQKKMFHFLLMTYVETILFTIFHLLNIFLQKVLMLTKKMTEKELLFFMHVQMISFQLFIFLLIKVLIWNHKI